MTFFPQLVAGPIVRAIDFLPQCLEPPRINSRAFIWGLWLVTVRLFQKVVIADGMLSKAADEVFGAADTLHPLDAWTGVPAFSGQILCDFAGYSTCAIGTALCLGFMLPNNFRFPYAALGFSDFWRRWRLTLAKLRGEVVADVRKIESRGGEVIFIRFPSTRPLREMENENTPKSVYWDPLIAETGCIGIHFEEHPELSNFDCPEWSHLTGEDSVVYTRELMKVLAAERAKRAAN